jgi:hypothetical protein
MQPDEKQFTIWLIQELRKDRKYHEVSLSCLIDQEPFQALVSDLTENQVREIYRHGEEVVFYGIRLKQNRIHLP